MTYISKAELVAHLRALADRLEEANAIGDEKRADGVVLTTRMVKIKDGEHEALYQCVSCHHIHRATAKPKKCSGCFRIVELWTDCNKCNGYKTIIETDENMVEYEEPCPACGEKHDPADHPDPDDGEKQP